MPEPLFTSYAQNFEDVILWRALKHIHAGFYIDIGAADPVVDSVSLAFYERGWRGIHIEPLPDYAAKLRQARPDEEVVEAAVAKEPGTLIFFSVPSWTELSTGDHRLADRHSTAGRDVKAISVKALTLAEIFDSRCPSDIHWLKIDVEGMEKQVIESWRPSGLRPWIVVVESTAPLSSDPSHADWHSSLEELGYKLAYFDGLNRFYVSLDHLELEAQFGPGPNLFDNFTLSGQANAPYTIKLNTIIAELQDEKRTVDSKLLALEAQNAALETRNTTLSAKLKALKTNNALIRSQLAAVSESASWRLTRPVRALANFVKRAFK